MTYDTDHDRYLEPPECADITCPNCDGTGKESINGTVRDCFCCGALGEVDRGLAVRIKKEIAESKLNY